MQTLGRQKNFGQMVPGIPRTPLISSCVQVQFVHVISKNLKFYTFQKNLPTPLNEDWL